MTGEKVYIKQNINVVFQNNGADEIKNQKTWTVIPSSTLGEFQTIPAVGTSIIRKNPCYNKNEIFDVQKINYVVRDDMRCRGLQPIAEIEHVEIFIENMYMRIDFCEYAKLFTVFSVADDMTVGIPDGWAFCPPVKYEDLLKDLHYMDLAREGKLDAHTIKELKHKRCQYHIPHTQEANPLDLH